MLHDVELRHAIPGTITAIVGPSGSGKSTVAKLMAGFWDATDGRVTFGGVDAQDIPYEQLMEHISYVAQGYVPVRPHALPTTSAWGKSRRYRTPRWRRRRARRAAHEFISALAAGLRLRAAGEAGERLSGGEKQRITIARAILKNASVVILDEATAYADPENEALVERAISKLVVGQDARHHRAPAVDHHRRRPDPRHGRRAHRGARARTTSCCRSCPLYAPHVARARQGGG